MGKIRYTDDRGSFEIKNPQHTSGLYAPVASLTGLKSAVTPDFGGDSKLDQNHFLLAPKSISNLHADRDTRNFFVVFDDEIWSATGASALQEARRFTDKEDDVTLSAGRMWQSVTRVHPEKSIKATARIFALLDTSAEVLTVTIENTGKEDITFTPVSAIPVYGRSADNLRDHRHVTSLLNRAVVTDYGIVSKPTLSFDERGHQINDTTYYVYGADDKGASPVAFMGDVDKFIGEGGSYIRPRSLVKGEKADWLKPGASIDGKEIIAALKFEDVTLSPGEKKTFNTIIGVEDEKGPDTYVLVKDSDKIEKTFLEVKSYWEGAVPVHFKTGNADFDSFMEWVSFQPQLRRIYGCSFLPHHDYGRGGRGWRDLWQDCLALLLTDPDGVREMLLDNFKGVRMDGTNATIIGDKKGEFKSDRNGIPRVWMDHGFWPFLTVRLYMDQTGDLGILDEDVTYFKDRLICRAEKHDEKYDGKSVLQETSDGIVYEGTVLEHLLIENLTAILDVGDHNEIKLRNADWNDALDMAPDKGESVAFTGAYAGNLKDIASFLLLYSQKTGKKTVKILTEVKSLIAAEGDIFMADPAVKRAHLNHYMESVAHTVSGGKEDISIEELALSLEKKADFMMAQIREKEYVSDDKGNHFFNGYYDNNGNRVEGSFDTQEGANTRMMLTGQVFSIMSGTALESQIKEVVKSADEHLYDERIGGYKLNTDFKEVRTDLGRMFGFSYGDKENGAVFSHMEVMFGNALYKRGFAAEGYKALNTLYKTCADFETSRIYPGVPEYINAEGRGLYHYLTGAGSWYLLTVLTESFGLRGNAGDLHIEPKLVKEQFDDKGVASAEFPFRGHDFKVIYKNASGKNAGEYRIGKVTADGKDTAVTAAGAFAVDIPFETIDKLGEGQHVIEVELV